MRQDDAVHHSVDQPGAITVAWSIFRSLLSTAAPNPRGVLNADHTGFEPVLRAVSMGGLGEAARHSDELESYLKDMESHDPDDMDRDSALAFWLNLYNAAAVKLGVTAWIGGKDSVVRIKGGFKLPSVDVGGESLSLDDIEHGKIRRFRDPRIHGALVCGSLSCPTLRRVPYSGDDLGVQLDEQMRRFLTGGGAVRDGPVGVRLSRLLLWYGSDFVRPHRMPTFVPASRKAILDSVRPWLPAHLRHARSASFQDYDWGLACWVG